MSRPFQDVDASAARNYAINTPIESTDTLLHLLEQAFLAGCARSHQPQPERAPNHSLQQPRLHQSESLIPTHEDGVPLYPIYHRNGELRCQKVALYHRGLVDPVNRADLTKLRIHPSMRIPTPHDIPRCGSCGIVIDPYSTQDLDWKPLLLFSPRPAPEPGADSLSGDPTEGRTPEVADPDPDVQPSAQQQHGDARPHLIQLPLPLPDATTPPNPPASQIDHLHQLATNLFEERRGPSSTS